MSPLAYTPLVFDQEMTSFFMFLLQQSPAYQFITRRHSFARVNDLAHTVTNQFDRGVIAFYSCVE